MTEISGIVAPAIKLDEIRLPTSVVVGGVWRESRRLNANNGLPSLGTSQPTKLSHSVFMNDVIEKKIKKGGWMNKPWRSIRKQIKRWWESEYF